MVATTVHLEGCTMMRNLVGFAAFAVIALFVLKILGTLFGIVIGLFGTILWLAFWGFVIYLILKVFSPRTAARVKEEISGKPSA